MSEAQAFSLVREYEQPPAPELLALSAAIDGLAQAAAQTPDVSQVHDTVVATFNAVDIWGTLENHAANTKGIGPVVHSLNNLDVAAGEDNSGPFGRCKQSRIRS